MSKRQRHAPQRSSPTLARCHARVPAGRCLSCVTDFLLGARAPRGAVSSSRKQCRWPETSLLVTTKRKVHRRAHDREERGPERPRCLTREPLLWGLRAGRSLSLEHLPPGSGPAASLPNFRSLSPHLPICIATLPFPASLLSMTCFIFSSH